MKKVAIFSVIFLAIDFILKFIISNCLKLYEVVILIPNFFSLMYVKNTGAAFSVLEGNRFLFIFISLIALFFIYNFFIKNSNLQKYEIITYSLLIGGVIGNLVDRIIYGYVIDYLYFNFGFDFPIFNLADCFIVISIILIVLKEVVRCKN